MQQIKGDMNNHHRHHHFVFVHGAGHGAWCWYKLKNKLCENGHKATCIDLKGAGINLADPNTISSLEEYNKPLLDFLSELPGNEKVILVSHSIGGGSATAAMCSFPHRISMSVYVAAAMVKPGSPVPPTVQNFHQGVQNEHESKWEYIYGNGKDKPPTSMMMKPEYIRQTYYNQSPMEDYTLATTLLRPSPINAFEGIGRIEKAPEIEAIPRVYVKTAKDNMFSPSAQDCIVNRWPPSQQFVLEDSDHSAFFSAPEALHDCLLQAASSISK
ncbi:PREDICTED: methylesterase 18 isoform X1 [Tarenaya hassleriana]|uniref:methylesterase 18 isoform X1 n=1 Tax=Tarenaya hassleriana TaxID=28532 RepID=UPI00053C31E1|nr:PREDICTED: methylesterase 18 isoform X1 [Tarenaya hassleriana]